MDIVSARFAVLKRNDTASETGGRPPCGLEQPRPMFFLVLPGDLWRLHARIGFEREQLYTSV
jgi:hypothetical protein